MAEVHSVAENETPPYDEVQVRRTIFKGTIARFMNEYQLTVQATDDDDDAIIIANAMPFYGDTAIKDAWVWFDAYIDSQRDDAVPTPVAPTIDNGMFLEWLDRLINTKKKGPKEGRIARIGPKSYERLINDMAVQVEGGFIRQSAIDQARQTGETERQGVLVVCGESEEEFSEVD